MQVIKLGSLITKSVHQELENKCKYQENSVLFNLRNNNNNIHIYTMYNEMFDQIYTEMECLYTMKIYCRNIYTFYRRPD